MNNISYTRLLRIFEQKSGTFGLYCNTIVQAAALDTLGYFRNDSVQKKVWLKLAGLANEVLLYDFDLLVGDTVPTGYFDDPTVPVINVVDSIYAENYGGIVRTVYRINRIGPCSDPKVYLIERIGSKSSFLKPLGNCGNFGVSSVLCFSLDSLIVLVNNNVTIQPPCGLLTSIAKRKSTMKGQIQISPNPTQGAVYIATSQGIEQTQVFNLQGQVVKKFNFPSTTIDIGDLNRGVYFLKIELHNGQVVTKKVVKE